MLHHLEAIEQCLIEESQEEPESEVQEQLQEEMGLSLQAIFDLQTSNTIKFKGELKRRPLTNLVDSGSTHSFLDVTITQKLKVKVVKANKQLVTVGNGQKTSNQGLCAQLHWKIQGKKFCKDLRILQLEFYN